METKLKAFDRMISNYKPIITNIESQIDIGFCTVDQTTQKNYFLENPNNFPVKFEIQQQTFKILPDQGILLPQQRQLITLTYKPTEATAVVSNIIINFEQEQPKVIKVSAIGKYAYISLSQNTLQFNQLLVGKTMSKDLIIKNSSPVNAEFKIQQIQDDLYQDNSFQLSETQGNIPANSSYLIKVTFKPQISNQTSIVHYNITCLGGNEQTLECTGFGQPFQIYVDIKSINFGEVKLGKKTSHLLLIHNDSDLPCGFQFYIGSNNIFRFNQTQGYVNPKNTKRIIIEFEPNNTICYYQRVYCMTRNHQVLYVDLIGTCYDLTIQPTKLIQKHIDHFRARVILGKLSPIDFKYMEKSQLNATNVVESNLMVNAYQQSRIKSQMFEVTNCFTNPFPTNQTVLSKEMIQLQSSNNKLISFNVSNLDFGYTEYLSTSGTQEIVLTNNMNCKFQIFWTIQKHKTIQESELSIFSVQPEVCQIKPKSSQTFYVTFRPVRNQFYFFQELQFFAYKLNTKKEIKEEQINLSNSVGSSSKKITSTKQLSTLNRSQTKKEDIITEEMIPPFCGQIQCVGHSFNQSSEPFVPIIEYKPSNKVLFKTCGIDENDYQTVEIHNQSDTPTYFQFGSAECFQIFPKQGLIQGKDIQIITIEFNPKKHKLYNVTVNIMLNYRLSNLKLNLYGYCSKPKLKIDNKGQIYFPPTYLGVCSRGQLMIQNQSRVNLQWKVDIQNKFQNELDIIPSSGEVNPNEIFYIKFEFIPYRKKEYKIKCNLEVKEVINQNERQVIGYWNPGSGKDIESVPEIQGDISNYLLEIMGAGSDGQLNISPSKIDFDIVKVNFNKKIYCTLQNISQCTFFVEIKLKYKNKTMNNKQSIRDLQKNFTLDWEEGIVAASSKINIGIQFNPSDVSKYDLILEVIAKEENLQKNTQRELQLSSQKCELEIKAQGSYPLLKIVDVRNNAISVATLWENFSINKINQELLQNLNENEKLFLNIETLNFVEVQALQKKLKSYEWNFGYLPSKAHVKPRKIVITIQNIGGTELNYNFKLPSDNQIQVEPWADPGEPTDEDAYQKAIIEKNIFQINPKKGVLAPNGYKDIELIYSPGNIDDNFYSKKQEKKKNEDHFLRVILNIVNGKPLVINLRGMTLAPLEGRLAVKKNNYVIPNTPIGLLLPVKFPIEIQNVGSSKISYRIQKQELDEKGLIIDSQFDIFAIENQTGNLPLQNEKQYLYCLFKPLENKTYYHEVTIIVQDIQQTVIQTEKLFVQGTGFSQKPKELTSEKREEIPSARSYVSQIGSKVFFSIEEIDFGTVLPNKSIHRIIILYNLNTTNKLHFDFDQGGSSFALRQNRPGLMCGDEFLIEPLRGDLECGAFVELKLTLIPAKEPSIYQGEIECLITWYSQEEAKDGNKNQTSQPATLEKETLFLRVKKTSSLDVAQINSFKENQFVVNEQKDMFEVIFENLIKDVINNHYTESILQRIDHQPIQLFENFDNEEPADINSLIPFNEKGYKQYLSITKDYRQMFLEEEFIELTDLIMENSFFNIICETTRKECDLLRISKTFVMPSGM